MAFRTIEVQLRADIASFTAQMGAAGAAVKGFGVEATKMAASGNEAVQMASKAGLILGGAVAAGFVGAATVAARFEKAMSAVKAVSGASASEMKRLADAALEAGANQKLAGVTAMDAAKAQAELVKAGVSVTDILNGGLNGALTLAAAGQIEFADAATIAAQAMNIFDLRGSDVTHVADVMAAAANKSAADVEGLGASLRQGGLVAEQTGLTFEETTGALAAFADNALIGSDAGTSLKTMLQRLTPTSKEAAGVMDYLGFSAYDAQGQFIGLEGLAGELASSFGDLNPKARNTALSIAFGSDAIRGANILMNEGAEGIAEYVTAVDDQGAAARMAGEQTDNLAGDVEALGGALESALIENGGKVTGVLRAITSGVTDVVTGFSALPDSVQTGVVGLVGATGLIAGIGGAAGMVIPKIKAAQDALAELGTAGGKLNTVGMTIGGMLGPAAVAGVAVTGVMTLLAKAAGQAEAEAKALVSTLTSDVDMSSTESMSEGFASVQDKLADLRAEWEAMTGGGAGSDPTEGMRRQILDVVQILTPMENKVRDTDAAIAALEKTERELGATLLFTETNLTNISKALGITEEEAQYLAETAGIDLAGGFKETRQAAEAAYAEMQAGGDITKSVTTDLEAEAKAAQELAEDLAELAGSTEPWILAMLETGEITKKQAQAMQKDVEAAFEAIGEAFGGFTDVGNAYSSTFDRLEAANRAAAERMAEDHNKSISSRTEASKSGADEIAKALTQEAEDHIRAAGLEGQAAADVKRAAAEKADAVREGVDKEADALKDGTKSWEDFASETKVTMSDWIVALEEQVAAQEEWKVNLARIAAVAGADVAAELSKMGLEGAEAVATFADSSEAEMIRAGELLVAAGRDGTQDTGRAMQKEWETVAAIGRMGAYATAAAVAEEVELGVADVERIAGYYGVALANGINPVLQGVGKPLVPVGRVGIGAVAALAEGGLYEQHAPQIASAGPIRVWAEPETGGEAYIPLLNTRTLEAHR